jgi:hypothetical protein
MHNRQLVTTKTADRKVTQRTDTGIVAVKDGVPAAVKMGITDLFLAFPAGAQQGLDERARSLQI